MKAELSNEKLENTLNFAVDQCKSHFSLWQLKMGNLIAPSANGVWTVGRPGMEQPGTDQRISSFVGVPGT